MNYKKKVIFFTYIPSPYRVDFFNELSKVCDLTVVFYYPNMPDSPWQNFDKERIFNHFFLFDKKSFVKGIIHNFKFLYEHKNDIIVIGGYAKLVELFSIFFLKIFKIDFILNSDGGFITKGFFKTLIKKKLIQSASSWLSSGVNATKSLSYYGAQSDAIYEYHFTSIFSKEVESHPLSKPEISVLRREFNLKEDIVYIVFVGQLINRKGVDVLIKSLEFVNNSGIEILIIGSGPEQEALIKAVNNLKSNTKVHFLGKLHKELVLQYLKISDIFVFPSREDIWGLVLNEAIANGLPVISTNKVGSAYSLIHSDENGYVIDGDNPLELAEAINELLLNDLTTMKEKSIAIAQKYTIEQMVADHIVAFSSFESTV